MLSIVEHIAFPLICSPNRSCRIQWTHRETHRLERFSFHFPHLRIGFGVCVVGDVLGSCLGRVSRVPASEGPNILETVPSLVDFPANRNSDIDPSSATRTPLLHA